MGRYRKKPVEIDAVRLTRRLDGSERSWAIDHHRPGQDEWLSAARDDGTIRFSDEGLHIQTLEGEMLASPGDWIIQGVQGEIYPCKPDIFEKTYEPVDGQQGARVEPDQEVIRDRWTVKAQIDATCARCRAQGLEMKMAVPVEVTARDGHLLMSQERFPARVECLSCGATVRYGEVGMADLTDPGETVKA